MATQNKKPSKPDVRTQQKSESKGSKKVTTSSKRSERVLEPFDLTTKVVHQSPQKRMTKKPLFIKQIYVKNLFGYYTYKLPSDGIEIDYSRLMILYGDNGTGKTTILKCIYYLLTTKDNSGYKSELAKIKFTEFSITFENGLIIKAYRTDNIIGSYTLQILHEDGTTLYELPLESKKSDYSISLAINSDQSILFREILEFIDSQNIVTYYLADDRKLLNNFQDGNSSINDRLRREFYISNRIEFNDTSIRYPSGNASITETIENLIEWVRRKIIDASNSGEENSLNIYVELVKNIANSDIIENSKTLQQELIETFERIAQRSISFIEFGLINKNEYSHLTSLIDKLDIPEKVNLVYKILKPFLNSIEGRLEALRNLNDLLSELVTSLNNYYSSKTVSFDVNEGLSIKHKKGENIDLEDLSSGEKQLLILLINSITAADSATIFIIDEPEISLNVKWQRTLTKTLKDISRFSKVQYIIATHSIELLASDYDNVIKVEEK